MSYKESDFEQAVLELMQDKLGYEYAYGPEVERDYHDPLYKDMLQSSLQDINPELPQDALDEAIYKLQNYQVRSLVQKNEVFMDYLQNGVEVGYLEQGVQKYAQVKLIDYEHINRNSFYVVNQWTVVENSTKRPDVVIFVNGLPLVIVELKSCTREETDVSDAYRQLRNYMKEIPSLFTYNAFCIMSDLVTSKAGTITADEGRYMEWKTVSGDYEETRYAKYNTLFEGMLEKGRLLDILRNFILFSKEESGAQKILAAYHQYFAVKKAVDSTSRATETDGKAGIFWHTQGSGKSLSMVFYAKLLQSSVNSPTIVVITDRNDLDDQLFSQFAKCSEFLRQTPVQAADRDDLVGLLDKREANGIIFTTMQKFEEQGTPLSTRRNIILMADEAHRSQYAIDEKIDKKTGEIKRGFARLVRDNLPNATFIGFTGTPIEEKDRNTREVFGNYIDVYDMTQSVADGATRPVYYESRVINLKLNTEVLREIDEAYDAMAQNADSYAIEKSKQQMGRMESILGAPQTIDSLCRDIIAHYEDRQDLLTGKALIVAYSRPIAMEIYHKILDLRPGWTEKVKVVMTSGNNDPEEWRDIIGNKSYKQELAKKFKDNSDPMKIAIVVDMWLTGFDVPSLATMYLYKPMAGHNLMQAIARVNRVFQDKVGGLVVDYVGIARALKQAMSDFTNRDRQNYGDTDISKAAWSKFLEKLEVCKDLFYGFDLTGFIAGRAAQRAETISDGINFILEDDHKKEQFLKEALLLRQAQSLCRSLLSKEQRFEAAYFEVVRTAITKITMGRKLSLKEINGRINELLKQSIKSEGVINLFQDTRQEFNLFNPAFLAEIAEMKQKNLAAELLRRLVSEQVTAYKKTNVVQAELFSERLQQLMNAYRNGQISNAEVIDELLKMANDISENRKAGDDMGLSPEEKAFYDALTRPRAIKDFYTNDILVQMTKELTDLLRKNQTIDWQKKETARAGMRRMVKHLLKKYKYPPEGVESATETVIEQCEMWTDNEIAE
jgi:type I restriction enzyme R subunit